jgi:hypothetical protein
MEVLLKRKAQHSRPPFLTCLVQLLFKLKIAFTFSNKTSSPNEEANCTELSPSVSYSWHLFIKRLAERLLYIIHQEITKQKQMNNIRKLLTILRLGVRILPLDPGEWKWHKKSKNVLLEKYCRGLLICPWFVEWAVWVSLTLVELGSLLEMPLPMVLPSTWSDLESERSFDKEEF